MSEEQIGPVEPITLPGDIPGLIRKGSPAFWLGEPGIVTRVYDDGTAVLWQDWGCDVWRALAEIGLDLTDRTGRAHAVWWLGTQVAQRPAVATWRMADGALRWWKMPWTSLDYGAGGAIGSEVFAPRDVPALSTLEPHDTRILPDGSRWVDAEALRLVCLHVAGRAP